MERKKASDFDQKALDLYDHYGHGRKRMYRSFVLLLVCAALSILSFAEKSFADGELPKAKRVVFLGDSITHSGGYIVSLEAAIIVQHPEVQIELLNLGLPSETVSGLSEPGHAGGQFPRPDLHERLQRVLEQTKPDLVIACYGMNDGIYYPLDERRFAKFKSGMERLHQSVVDSGADIIHLTPAYFDALPIRDRLLPAGKEEYPQPYEGYDEVLSEYARWLLSRRADGWVVLDVHQAMRSAVEKARVQQPTFTFATDGVHPNGVGQAVIAEPLATAWGLKLESTGLPKHPRAEELYKLLAEKQNTLKLAWLTSTRHVRPGIPAGKSIQEAERVAQELDAKARKLVRETN